MCYFLLMHYIRFSLQETNWSLIIHRCSFRDKELVGVVELWRLYVHYLSHYARDQVVMPVRARVVMW